jgi:hypothetical protein
VLDELIVLGIFLHFFIKIFLRLIDFSLNILFVLLSVIFNWVECFTLNVLLENSLFTKVDIPTVSEKYPFRFWAASDKEDLFFNGEVVAVGSSLLLVVD